MGRIRKQPTQVGCFRLLDTHHTPCENSVLRIIRNTHTMAPAGIARSRPRESVMSFRPIAALLLAALYASLDRTATPMYDGADTLSVRVFEP